CAGVFPSPPYVGVFFLCIILSPPRPASSPPSLRCGRPFRQQPSPIPPPPSPPRILHPCPPPSQLTATPSSSSSFYVNCFINIDLNKYYLVL
ncbi:hypothetical protein MUK42_32759, partial [Musa troglodytarum]